MSFTSVTWQDYDEVTSEKLQQMATNTDLLRFFQIAGNITFAIGENGQAPSARRIGIEKSNRLESLYVPFDSLIDVPFYDVRINYPNLNWIDPPVIQVTMAIGTGDPQIGVLIRDGDKGTSAYAIYRVIPINVLSRRIRGGLNVTLHGRVT